MNIIRLISNISPLNNLSSVSQTHKPQSISLQNSSSDIFDMSLSSRLNLRSKNILSKSKKFDISSYNSLSKTEKAVLKATSKQAEDAAEKSLKMGLVVKKHLDKHYGEGNYVFISIGTSPAGIARVLEFMGVETKYLPLSGLSFCSQDDYYKKFIPLLPKYRNFLETQGLSGKNIEESDKDYLFFDYTRSGRSLKLFQEIMRDNFGIDSNNIEYKSFDYECYASSAKKIDPEKYALDYVKYYVEQEHIADFCGIPHLPLWEIDKIDQCKNFESEDSKRFNFLIIDGLKRKKLLRNNPANKNSL